MSGGPFDDLHGRMTDAADQVDREIRWAQGESDEQGYSTQLQPATLDRFRETAQAMRTAAAMLQRVDWLLSGDDGEEEFHERWAEEVPSN